MSWRVSSRWDRQGRETLGRQRCFLQTMLLAMNINSANFVMSAPSLKGCPPPDQPEFAFIGRSNVGKSSLINLLTGRKGLAKVSVTPGKTQLINFFEINRKWTLVDLPGYGYAKVSKAQRADFNEAVADYLESRESLVHTYVLIDSRLPPQEIDKRFVSWMIGADIEFSLVFTKTDKQSSPKTDSNIAKFRREAMVGVTPMPTIFTSSSVSRAGKREIHDHIEKLLG